MENEKTAKQVVFTALAVAWCFVVAVAYYSFNVAYYVEKISTFGRFVLQLIGI